MTISASGSVVGGGAAMQPSSTQSLLGDTVLGGNYEPAFAIGAPSGIAPAATGGGGSGVVGGGGTAADGGSSTAAVSAALLGQGVGGTGSPMGMGALLDTPTGTGGLVQGGGAPAAQGQVISNTPGANVGGNELFQEGVNAVPRSGGTTTPVRTGAANVAPGATTGGGAGTAGSTGANAGAAQVKPPKTSTTKPKPKTKTITVKAGDTLAELAKRHKTTIAKLEDLNDIKRGTKLKAGRKLKVPA